LALKSFDPVLLVSGDLSAQGPPRIEAQMRDGDEGLVLHGDAEVELADDAAFVAKIVQASDGAVRGYRRIGILLTEFRAQLSTPPEFSSRPPK